MIIERARVPLNQWTDLAEITGNGAKIKQREFVLEEGGGALGLLRFPPINHIVGFGRLPFLTYYFDGLNGRELSKMEADELFNNQDSKVELQAFTEKYGLYLKLSYNSKADILKRSDPQPWFNYQTGNKNWSVVTTDSGLAISRIKVLVGEVSDQEIQKILGPN